jgi:hypothetical protein
MVALYIATSVRPEIRIKKLEQRDTCGNSLIRRIDEILGLAEASTNENSQHTEEGGADLGWQMDYSVCAIVEGLQKTLAPKKFGFETVDAINYFVELLLKLNAKVTCYDHPFANCH